MLIDDTERNLEDLLESVVEESEKKGLTVSYKKTENIGQDVTYKLEI